jgi:hypothetical protein
MKGDRGYGQYTKGVPTVVGPTPDHAPMKRALQGHYHKHLADTGAKPKLGSGERFAALKAKLADKPGVTDPGALAAAIGRKKYGAQKFAALSAKGRK